MVVKGDSVARGFCLTIRPCHAGFRVGKRVLGFPARAQTDLVSKVMKTVSTAKKLDHQEPKPVVCLISARRHRGKEARGVRVPGTCIGERSLGHRMSLGGHISLGSRILRGATFLWELQISGEPHISGGRMSGGGCLGDIDWIVDVG